MRARHTKSLTLNITAIPIGLESIRTELESAIICGFRQVARTGAAKLPRGLPRPNGRSEQDMMIDLDHRSNGHSSYGHLFLYRQGSVTRHAMADLTVFPKVA